MFLVLVSGMVSATVLHEFAAQTPQEVVAPIVDLIQRSHTMGYIGEKVTQMEHALQAAYKAYADQKPRDIVLGALLHDIGHICAPPDAEHMAHAGVANHERIGAQYLLERGFSTEVAALVEGHVRTKRYLVWRDKEYYDFLSDASKLTLTFQGGKMTDEEAAAFEKDPHFKDILYIRQCDEAAKVVPHPEDGPSWEILTQMMIEHIRENRESKST